MAQYALEPFLVTSRFCRTWLTQYLSYQKKSTLAIHEACKIAAQIEARSQKPSATEHLSSAQHSPRAVRYSNFWIPMHTYVRLLSAVHKTTCCCPR